MPKITYNKAETESHAAGVYPHCPIFVKFPWAITTFIDQFVQW